MPDYTVKSLKVNKTCTDRNCLFVFFFCFLDAFSPFYFNFFPFRPFDQSEPDCSEIRTNWYRDNLNSSPATCELANCSKMY